MNLIIGMGEVGQALYDVLPDSISYDNAHDDITFEVLVQEEDVGYLHVCIPMTRDFVRIVNEYIDMAKPKMTINHSTVEVGITRKLHGRKVHSPVRGTHPNIAKGLINYVKYVGADTADDYVFAIDGLEGMNTWRMNRLEASEMAKLLSRGRYGLAISFAKEQEKLCEEHGVLSSEVVHDWDVTYNEGMMIEGRVEYLRPLITPPKGSIGGHCVTSAMERLKEYSPM